MPANLTPVYYEAEKRFRAAKTVPEKITALEEMLAVMPKHKGTDHLKGDLRRRIAKLSQSTGRKGATQRSSMVVDKEGVAQLAVIGHDSRQGIVGHHCTRLMNSHLEILQGEV